MSQSNLFTIPIDESILLPMESLDQHLADSSKPSIISPILRNILLQYGEPAYDLLSYSETLPQEPAQLPKEDSTLTQEQNVVPDANIALPLEKIILPLGLPPTNYKSDVALPGEKQEIAFIRRSVTKKHPVENTETKKYDMIKIQKVKRKSLKKSKMSIDEIAKKIAKTQGEINDTISVASTSRSINEPSTSEQDVKLSTVKKKGKSKKRSKRKEVTEDQDKEPMKKKAKKNTLGKEEMNGPEEAKKQKTSSGEKNKSSKKRRSKKDLPSPIEKSTLLSADNERETASKKRKSSIPPQQQSSNDNLLQCEEENNVSNSSPAKRPRTLKKDITNPIYLEPFKYGWVREVVYRSNQSKSSKIQKADTYYHAPNGKKFRTFKEMSGILSGNDHLTEDNFTYLQQPLGLNDPTKEIVRNSFDTAFNQRKIISRTRAKIQELSSQNKDSSVKDINNISLNMSEQNSDVAVTENVEHISTISSNSQLEQESVLCETNMHEATSKNIAEPIDSLNEFDTTIAACYNNVEERSNSSNSSEITETAELDNDEAFNDNETSSETISSNVEKLNTQDDNDIRNVSDRKCHFKNVNLSTVTTNIKYTTENTEIEPLKSIDLISNLNEEIESSSFNSITEEINSNKEYESSSKEQKLDEYSDTSESDYKLELDVVPEKNIEELNSSFSEKMIISETSMKTSGTTEITASEDKNPFHEQEILNDSKENNVSFLENFTSPDTVKVNAANEKTKSLLETSTKLSNTIKVNATDEKKLLIENWIMSSNTAEVNVTDETKLLQETEAEPENLVVEKTSQSNLGSTHSIDHVIEISHDLMPDKVCESKSSSTSLDPMEVTITDEKENSLQNTAIDYSITDDSSSNFNAKNSITNELEKSDESKLNTESVPESSSTLSNPSKVYATDEEMNSERKSDTASLTINNSLNSNLEQTGSTTNAVKIPYNLKANELSASENFSTSSIATEVNTIGENINPHKKSDADSLTDNNTLQNNIDQIRSNNSGMEIASLVSCISLSTTLSVTLTDSLTISSDSAVSSTQTSSSQDRSRSTLTSSATFSQSSTSAELASSSNETLKSAPQSSSSTEQESLSSDETPKSASENSENSVTEDKTVSLSETLSVPLDKEVATASDVQTSKEENIEKPISIADFKDSFNDVKTLLEGGLKKVEQGLYDSSETYSDAAENTYLVNTEGNTFSFTTASFKQSKQLLTNKEVTVSHFNDDINCMKTIAESIKTLSLPSDLTNKQYFLSCQNTLTNEIMQNKYLDEMKTDNFNLNNVNQISSEEENLNKKFPVSCSKDNITKIDTSDCIQKVETPSIVISCSKNILLELDNSIVNKNQNLASEKDESSDPKKMNNESELSNSSEKDESSDPKKMNNESELSNSSERSDPMCSNTLKLTTREDTIETTAKKSECVESNSPEFVRSESYEYQNSSRDEDYENIRHLNEDNLDDTLSTSGSTGQDNLYEHSNLVEKSDMRTYADYLVSNEFPEIIDKLAKKNEFTLANVNVIKSEELHNDLCEFIKLPPKKLLYNAQEVSSDQTENQNNLLISNVDSIATEEISALNNYNVAKNLTDNKNAQKQTYANQTTEKMSLYKCIESLSENSESNSKIFANKNINPILTNVSTPVLNKSIKNDANNVLDQNLEKLVSGNEMKYSFDCSEDTLIQLNKLLEMSCENEDEYHETSLDKMIQHNLNVSSSHSTNFKQETSVLKEISNSPTTPDRSLNKIKKPINQSTPLSKYKSNKSNLQSKLTRPHSMLSFCAGYSALKHIFEYLHFEDLLIAMEVCTVWKEIAQQLHLWKTIRIRNSQLTPRLAKILQNYETNHLLVVEEDSNDWTNFINILPEIKCLRVIELCPCPAVVFENIVKNCPQLKIVNALSLKDESINIKNIINLSDPEKLQLGGVASMSMEGDLTSLSGFSNLTHLSLRSIKDLGSKNVKVLQSLQELQSLELGECSEFTSTFGSTTLVELKNLKRLRLEKVQGSDCCADILTSVSTMERLTQLELVNVEVSRSFLKCLPECENIKKLLVIPMYRKRIAFSNNVIIKCTTKLRNLVRFVWGIPEEFVLQTKSLCERPYDDCISVLKPIPFQKVFNNMEDYVDFPNPTEEVDTTKLKVLPLHILKRFYAIVLPNTQTDILKIPAFASWNLSIT